MKTSKKTIALTIASLFTSFAFGQVNLGITSATQAAVKATAGTGAILQTTNAVSAATRSTLNTATMTTAGIAATTGTVVTTTGKQVTAVGGGLKNELAGQADLKAGATVSGSSQTALGTQGGQLSAGAEVNQSSSAGAGIQLNGQNVIEKTDKTATDVLVTAENQSAAALKTAKQVNAQVRSELKSDVQAAGQAATSVKPKAEAAAEAKTSTSATVSKQ